MTDVKILRMTVGHIDEIHEISVHSFPLSWSKEDLLREVYNEKALNLVSMSGDRVVGYVNIWHVFDEADIINIAVHQDARGHGIARDLLNEALKQLKELGVREVYLEVRVSNTAAQALYRGFGFKVEGIRRKYYANGEDAYNMHLNIDSFNGIPSVNS
jgi:ribosomal-protein-alanine N-acetyltransferase